MCVCVCVCVCARVCVCPQIRVHRFSRQPRQVLASNMDMFSGRMLRQETIRLWSGEAQGSGCPAPDGFQATMASTATTFWGKMQDVKHCEKLPVSHRTQLQQLTLKVTYYMHR